MPPRSSTSRTATWRAACGLVVALAGCGACRSGSGELVGHHVEPTPPEPDEGTGLTFPLEPPPATPLVRVRAFPELSFDRPVLVTHAPGDTERLFVLEQAGRIWVFSNDDDVKERALFLDIRDRVRRSHNEEGLLGLAFDPDYAASGVFYLYYSASSPRRAQISRFSVTGDPDRADPGSEEPLLAVEQPFGNHNGGTVAFGPDGMLYAGFGDGGSAGDPLGAGQDLGTLLGTIIRVNAPPTGALQIPTDNPFVDREGARPEIWALGLRNPWRFSFDRQTGTLWAGDVGQDRYEEIDIVTRGGNYGWRRMEGAESFDAGTAATIEPVIDPVVAYGRSDGESVTGGYVYRGLELPAYRGAYIYGDYVTGKVWALRADPEGKLVSNTEIAGVPSLSSFGEDGHGELLAVSLDGGLYRFALAEEKDAAPAFPTLLSQTGVFADTTNLVPNPDLLPYAPRVELWSDGAQKARWLALPEGETIGFSEDGEWSFPVGTVTVKHFELPTDDADPTRTVRLETRVMVHETAGWSGYTYRWNAEQTDAVLVTSPQSGTFEVRRGGQAVQQVWAFPHGSDCLRCHTEGYGRVLGIRTRQLHAEGETGGGTIADWAAKGLFSTAVDASASRPVHPRIDDEGADLQARARAYLDVNCAVCHHPGGPAPGSVDLRVQTPLSDTQLLNVVPESAVGLPGERRIAPGDHASSSVWARVQGLGEERMPPLASRVRDDAAVQLLASWIDALPAG